MIFDILLIVGGVFGLLIRRDAAGLAARLHPRGMTAEQWASRVRLSFTIIPSVGVIVGIVALSVRLA